MKFAIVGITVLTTIAPVVSCWKLQLFAHEGYKQIIYEKSGSGSKGCTSLDEGGEMASGRANSMKWDGDGFMWGECGITLYVTSNCKGDPIAHNEDSDWNVPKFTSKAANKAASYKVDC